MKSRNFSALGANTAAQLNAGTIGVQKDKNVYLDPETEILYDPVENIRNGNVVDESLDGLIELRLKLDQTEQLQPIRVYPLPPEKLDPSKPAMKYGIGFGHRRTLCCRLTSADSPLIKGGVRKVKANIDVEWLKQELSYQLELQIDENTARLDLNHVELGQALMRWQQTKSKEKKRHVSQKEVMERFRLKEKTVFNLLKAAEFHELAKDVCHRNLLKDLDTMVTFDVICRANEPMAQAIYTSLQQEGAPSNRSLIRQARIMAEDKDYVFDPLTWAWPESVMPAAATPVRVAPGPTVGAERVAPTTPPAHLAGGGQEFAGGSPAGADHSEEQASEAPAGVVPLDQTPSTEKAEVGQQSGHKLAEAGGADAKNENTGSGSSLTPSTQQQHTTAPPATATASHQPATAPVIMVEFKMAADAPKAFTGELLVGKKAKGASNGVVAYLNEGREEYIEVPLKLIHLVSIHHQ